jgi:hypothetical protein
MAAIFQKQESTKMTDPQGPSSGLAKVYRDGSWYDAGRCKM